MESLLLNSLQVRLAETSEEIEAAQALRYRVFYEEMSAAPTPEMKARRLDFDDFDPDCEHLLVFDLERNNGTPAVVGTYRLMTRPAALRHGGFYTEQEYDVSPLHRFPGGIVEVGRSCVDPAYRSRGVMQMLWRGFADYVRHNDLNILFGCASFPGTEPKEMGPQLSYLHHHHLAPQTLRPRALAHHYVPMDVLPPSEFDAQAILNELPPLIKGYLRLGGFVGDGAVVDHQFNTTDVCVIVKTDQLTEKYDRRYRQSIPEKAERGN